MIEASRKSNAIQEKPQRRFDTNWSPEDSLFPDVLPLRVPHLAGAGAARPGTAVNVYTNCPVRSPTSPRRVTELTLGVFMISREGVALVLDAQPRIPQWRSIQHVLE